MPKQFPLKPGYHKPDEDYSAEQLPTVTESMVRDALNYDKTKGCLGTSPCFWSIMFLFKPAAVTKLIEEIVTNIVPEPISNILRSVNYTCLVYEETNKLRAVGSNAALLKITQRVLLQSNKKKIQELAKTHGEFGNGVGHGATAAAVKIMGQIQEMTGQDNRATLAVVVMDLSGAFPNTPRSVLRSQLKTHLPLLVPLFDVMYGSPNKHRILKDDGLVHELIRCYARV